MLKHPCSKQTVHHWTPHTCENTKSEHEKTTGCTWRCTADFLFNKISFHNKTASSNSCVDVSFLFYKNFYFWYQMCKSLFLCLSSYSLLFYVSYVCSCVHLTMDPESEIKNRVSKVTVCVFLYFCMRVCMHAYLHTCHWQCGSPAGSSHSCKIPLCSHTAAQDKGCRPHTH